MPLTQLTDAEFAHAMWTFTGGAILFLLQSIYSQTVRNWWSLLIGCVFGGLGSWIAGQIWGDSEYVYIICGVAAVTTANLIQGAVNATQAFADDPIEVGIKVGKSLLPWFKKAPEPDPYGPYPGPAEYPGSYADEQARGPEFEVSFRPGNNRKN